MDNSLGRHIVQARALAQSILQQNRQKQRGGTTLIIAPDFSSAQDDLVSLLDQLAEPQGLVTFPFQVVLAHLAHDMMLLLESFRDKPIDLADAIERFAATVHINQPQGPLMPCFAGANTLNVPESVESKDVVSHVEKLRRDERQPLVIMSNVWFQVDPVPARLTLPNSTYKEDMSQILSATLSGIFCVSRLRVSWRAHHEEQAALFLLEHDIVRFTSGTLETKEHSTHKIKKAPMAASHYVSVHSKEQVMHFYPFSDAEKQNVLDALSVMSGLRPFAPDWFVRNAFNRKLEKRRRAASISLHRQHHPWIESSSQLEKALAQMTAEAKPTRIVDIERLYHSCRYEKEVTKEALIFLRKIWYSTASETVRLKVLNILDRLLDRTIMRTGDSAFETTLKWLRHLEDTISPYKSAEALSLVMKMVKRAQQLQIEPLATVADDSCTSTFDDWDDYCAWAQFFHS